MKINLTNKTWLATSSQLEKALYSDFAALPPRDFLEQRLAIISVQGLLLHRFENFGSSYESIRDQIQQALSIPSIEQIILDIDSGGGEINGLFDLVDFIVEARKQKPITALINESAYSAAYLIATSANQIIAPRTASVGSIGVIVTHLDQSEAETKAGFKFTEVYAGQHKIDFSPHQPLSDLMKVSLQEQVDETYALLLQTLSRNRAMPESLFKDTEAQIYSSPKALTLQLIDKIQSPNQFLEEQMMIEEQPDVSNSLPMPSELLATERERAKNIMNICKLAKYNELACEFIERGTPLEEVRKALFEKMVAHSGEPIINAIEEKPAQNNHLINSILQGLRGA